MVSRSHSHSPAGYDPALVVDEAMAVFLRARNNVVFYDGVLPMLMRLKERGFVLGSVSNGNADVSKIPM